MAKKSMIAKNKPLKFSTWHPYSLCPHSFTTKFKLYRGAEDKSWRYQSILLISQFRHGASLSYANS